MSPIPPRFTEDEIYAAVRGAQRAGANVAVEISPDGTLRLVPMGQALARASNVPAAAPLREILKIEDVAKHWNVSARSVRAAIAAGKIGHFRVGTLIRIKRDEVERVDREGGVQRKAEPDPIIPYVPKSLGMRPGAFELGRRSRNPKPKPK